MHVAVFVLLLVLALGGWGAPVPGPEPWIQPWIRGREKEFEKLNSTDTNPLPQPEFVNVNVTSLQIGKSDTHSSLGDLVSGKPNAQNDKGHKSETNLLHSGYGQKYGDFNIIGGDFGLGEIKNRTRRSASSDPSPRASAEAVPEPHATPEALPQASPIASPGAESHPAPDSVHSGSPVPTPVHSPLAYNSAASSDTVASDHERRESSGPNPGPGDIANSGPNAGPSAGPNAEPQSEGYYSYTNSDGVRIYYTLPSTRPDYYHPSYPSFPATVGTSSLSGYNRQTDRIYGSGHGSRYGNEYPNFPNSIGLDYNSLRDGDYGRDYYNRDLPLNYRESNFPERPGGYNYGYLPGNNPYNGNPSGFQQPTIVSDYTIPYIRPDYVPNYNRNYY